MVLPMANGKVQGEIPAEALRTIISGDTCTVYLPGDEAQLPVIEVPAEPACPIEITASQIRRALTRAGLRAQVEAAVAGGPQDLRDMWEFEATIHRTHPLVMAMASQLGIGDVQLDELFRLAGSL